MRRRELMIYGPNGEVFPFCGVKADGKLLKFHIGGSWETVAKYSTKEKALEVQREIVTNYTARLRSAYYVPAK